MRFVADQGHNHAVQVEEEHQQVETQLDERLLLVHVQLAEDLSRIQQVLVLVDPVFVSILSPATRPLPLPGGEGQEQGDWR